MNLFIQIMIASSLFFMAMGELILIYGSLPLVLGITSIALIATYLVTVIELRKLSSLNRERVVVQA